MNSRLNIFDFDGTIAETNLLKTEAFKFAAKNFGDDIQKWFVSYHQRNGGVTRQEKIKFLCNKIGKPSLYNNLLNEYESYLNDQWLGCPLLPGFCEYIENLDGTNVILSGGSKVEIENYLDKNNLTQYFVGVYGNPTAKDVNLSEISKVHVHPNTDVYFYGDSQLDYDLSIKAGAKFVYLEKVSEWAPLSSDRKCFFQSIDDYNCIL